VKSYAQDDATLALAAFGFYDFTELQTRFARRRAQLQHEHVAPLDALDPADSGAFDTARAESWARYRAGYERLMPRAMEG
jgi:hypothetical protein